MPLVAPHATLGGPANVERQRFFRRWWDEHQRPAGLLKWDVLENDVIQAQAHRTTWPSLRTAAALVGRDSVQYMRDARTANGDINTDPYRVILRAGPNYLALATASTSAEIYADWDALNILLARIRASEPGLTAEAYGQRLADAVVQRLVQVTAASDPELEQTLHAFAVNVTASTTIEQLNLLARPLLASLRTQNTNQTSPPDVLLKRDLLLARATIIRAGTQVGPATEGDEIVRYDDDTASVATVGWVLAHTSQVDVIDWIGRTTERAPLTDVLLAINLRLMELGFLDVHVSGAPGENATVAPGSSAVPPSSPPPPIPPPPPPVIDAAPRPLVIRRGGAGTAAQREAARANDMIQQLRETINGRGAAIYGNDA